MFLLVWNQATFEAADLNALFGWAISIQGKAERGKILRPDFAGRRLDLYFDDVLEGPEAATLADIELVERFGRDWVSRVRSEASLEKESALVVHCAAGVSRSAAVALLLLTRYFGDFAQAREYLQRTHPHVIPNALIVRLGTPSPISGV